MVYRIVYAVKVPISYYEREFVFDNMRDAGEFARNCIIHNVSNEDNKKELDALTIEVRREPKECEKE